MLRDIPTPEHDQDVSVPDAFKVEDFDPSLVRSNFDVAKR